MDYLAYITCVTLSSKEIFFCHGCTIERALLNGMHRQYIASECLENHACTRVSSLFSEDSFQLLSCAESNLCTIAYYKYLKPGVI
jgi:hypothetical protein